MELRPVVLAGGRSRRLWPLARPLQPAPFVGLAGRRPALEATLAALAPLGAPPGVICGEAHRFLAADAARDAGVELAGLLVEEEALGPGGAVLAAASVWNDGVLAAVAALVDPDPGTLCSLLAAAAEEAERGAVLRLRQPSPGGGRSVGVVARADVLRDVAGALARGGSGPSAGGVWVRGPAGPQLRLAGAGALLELEELFAAAASRGEVVERELPVRAGRLISTWADLRAHLAEAGEAASSAAIGDVRLAGPARSLALSLGPLVLASGTDGLAVVAAPDAVYVGPLDPGEEELGALAQLAREGREEALSPWRVPRPWGSYEILARGPRYQVKRLRVRPGHAISLQRHRHRAEHWVVVRGRARVWRGEDVFELAPDQSAYVPAGALHRLESLGPEELEVIEVQTGDYLGEDDIERFEDRYGRAGDPLHDSPHESGAPGG